MGPEAFWVRDLLYQSFRFSAYCPHCGVSFSDHEAAIIKREADVLSIYVRLPLVDEPGISLLVRTDTPWSLPANAAVTVEPETEYATIRLGLPEGGSEQLILSRSSVKQVFGEQTVAVVNTFKGKKLRGKRYQPLFTFLHSEKQAHYVILQKPNLKDEDTGIRLVAPAFSDEDLQSAIQYDLPIHNPITNDGTFVPEIRPWSGIFFKEADRYIINDLDNRGLLFSVHAVGRTEQFCGFCGSPLIHCGRNGWNIRISERQQPLDQLSSQISWKQVQYKSGSIGCDPDKTGDWIVSRERFWGTPLPIWQCEECHHQLAVGSTVELSRLTGRELSGTDLHKPSIDEIHFPCPECGNVTKRVPEVVADWFDLGALPVAQWHFPLENRSRFREQFPADLVCETTTQAHTWYRSMHVINALLFDNISYKNAITIQSIHDPDAIEQTNPRGSSTNPFKVFAIYGADALRWHFFTSPTTEVGQLSSANQSDFTSLKFYQKLWEVYTFFITHANLDRWQPAIQPDNLLKTGKTPGLDRWLLSELHSLVREVTQSMESL